MDGRVGLWRKLTAEEWMLSDCGVGEDSRVLWTARGSNQSILNEIRPECSLERLMLKLKLQCFGLLMWRADSFQRTLMLRKNVGKRRSGWPRMRCLDGITDSMDTSFGKLRELLIGRPAVLESTGLQSQTRLNDWIELMRGKNMKNNRYLYLCKE